MCDPRVVSTRPKCFPPRQLSVRGAAALALAILIAGAAACSRESSGKVYPIRGEVVSVSAARNGVVLAHDTVVGFMQAMTMSFPVARSELLDGISTGDRVEGVVLVEGARSTIVGLAKIEPATPPAGAAAH